MLVGAILDLLDKSGQFQQALEVYRQMEGQQHGLLPWGRDLILKKLEQGADSADKSLNRKTFGITESC